MRLLNVKTLVLEEFFDEESRPAYAILSHTWGAEEVTFQDLLWLQELREFEDEQPGPKELRKKTLLESRSGYRKVTETAKQARLDGLEYVWVDTCCIDKTSSAELSEAINSMYKWYGDSNICYAYLVDVMPDKDFPGYEAATPSPLKEEIRARALERIKRSRWFTRGWTLQELLAPTLVVFFSQDWETIGWKRTRRSTRRRWARKTVANAEPPDLNHCILQITKIPNEILFHSKPLATEPIAHRFSWVAARHTTRKEDMAYCLLGIFGVHMPLLYGEGVRAFVRLQEEILRQSEDSTILCWGVDRPILTECDSLFATCPTGFSSFRSYRDSHTCNLEDQSCFMNLINKGLRIRVNIRCVSYSSLVPGSSCPDGLSENIGFAELPAVFEPYIKRRASDIYRIALPVVSARDEQIPPDEAQLWRPVGGSPVRMGVVAYGAPALKDLDYVVLRRDVPSFAGSLHTRDRDRLWKRWHWQQTRHDPRLGPVNEVRLESGLIRESHPGRNSYLLITLASFPRIDGRRLELLEVFPPERWRPASRTFILGSKGCNKLGNQTSSSMAQEPQIYDDRVFARFGSGYHSPNQSCLVEIQREVFWDSEERDKSRVRVYTSVGSMNFHLSLADAFLSHESSNFIRDKTKVYPASEIPYELQRVEKRVGITTMLHLGNVKQVRNDFEDFWP